MYFDIIKKPRLPNEILIKQIKYDQKIPNTYPENTIKISIPGRENKE